MLTFRDPGGFSSVSPPSQHETSIFTMARGREEQQELTSALGCLGLEVTHVASICSLLSRSRYIDLYSCKGSGWYTLPVGSERGTGEPDTGEHK